MSATEKRTKMSKRRQQVGGLAVLALGLGAIAWIPQAGAEPETSVLARTVALKGYGITASTQELVVGSEVTVKVTAENVRDLYAYDLKLNYDPSVLKYVVDSATTDLTGSTYGLEDDGSVEVVHTKLGSSPAATGPVTLAEVRFTAVGVGIASVSATSLETVTTARETDTTTGVGAVPVQALAKAPVATVAPQISGTARVGKSVQVTPGTWDVAGVALSYQWRRGGEPIAGATAASYELVPGDVGRLVDVVVSASKKEHVSGAAVVAAGTVSAAGTSTRLTLPGSVKAGRPAPLKVTVASADLRPGGAVKVTYGGKVVKASLALNAAGQAAVKLPGRKAGRYQVKVVYLPTDGFAASTRTAKVRVTR
jgi:hypothetical protein